MKYSVVLIVLFLVSCGTQKLSLEEIEQLTPVKLYQTTNDFIQKKERPINAGILIKNESRQHININKFYDLNTGGKIKKAHTTWAIEYKDGIYFNLSYSKPFNNSGAFAKFDILGRYCAIIINENSPLVLKNVTNNYYGFGIAGVLINESQKWNKNWTDQYNLKVKILLVDTQDILPNLGVRKKYALGDYLSRKKLEEILEEMDITLTVNNMKEVKFEKVIKIIERANIKETIKTN